MRALCIDHQQRTLREQCADDFWSQRHLTTALRAIMLNAVQRTRGKALGDAAFRTYAQRLLSNSLGALRAHMVGRKELKMKRAIMCQAVMNVDADIKLLYSFASMIANVRDEKEN